MSSHLRGTHSRSSAQELRLLLLGNIGCGKTLSADTILGQPSSGSCSSPRSCQLRQGFFENRSVTLVEAPRWFWSGGKMEDSVKKETVRAMTLLAPGPHCILLLVPVSQFTEMEGRVPAELEEMFGKESLDHTLVLLTCGDYLMGRAAADYLQSEHPGLRQVIGRCGGRYHVINNRQQKDRDQVRELLEKVDNMVQQNGVCPTKTVHDTQFEKQLQERKQEIMESYRAQNVETRETSAVAHSRNVEALRSIDTGDEYSTILQRRRKERRDEVEGRVGISQVSNGLQSTPAPKPESSSDLGEDGQLNRTPSFRLSADGALLSQMSEVKSKKLISTFHHRINSFEEQSPAASPTSSLHSPVFSSNSPSSSVFAASPFSEPSSSSSSTFAISQPSIPSPSSTASSSSPELRLVMLGRSGAGKTTAGNKILGREEFEPCVITQECEKKKALVGGRRVAVVDTPDWFDSQNTPDEVRAQISCCVALSSPGPHAFLLCVPIDQPAKLELQALWALDTVFGPDAVRKHTLVLFTCVDRLRESGKMGGTSVEAYIASQRVDLLNLVERCADRFHVMETGEGGSERKNVVELLEKVEQVVKEAGGQFYSCPAFQEAETLVRQRQVEIAKQKKITEQLSSKRRHSYMQTLAEEEVRQDEIEKTRDEAEMSVRSMDIESLPPITASSLQPSVLRSVMDKMQCGAKTLPKLLADSSVWVREGAKQVQSSQAWGAVGSRAQNVQKMVADSSLWEKVGAGAGHVSKLVGDRVPQVVVDGSAWVGSGAKALAASPMWGKVGSGAKVVASSSMRVGAGIGTGAKTLAQSPVWEKVGSGAKAGAKMVARSPVWEKVGTKAKQVPKVVIGGALLGLLLGVFLWGVIGGAIGAAAGSAASEVGRRKYSKKKTFDKTDGAAESVATAVSSSVNSVAKQGDKTLKTD